MYMVEEMTLAVTALDCAAAVHTTAATAALPHQQQWLPLQKHRFAGGMVSIRETLEHTMPA